MERNRMMPETRSDAEEQGAWGRPVSARHGQAIVALVLLAAGLFVTWQAALLPFGTAGSPGPGLFPFALGIALALVAAVILFISLRSGEGDPVYLGHRNVLVVVAALIGVACVFELADAYLTLGVFAAALLLLVARAEPWRIALGASVGMVAVWAFFNQALGVRLPVGEFWGEIAGFVADRLPWAPL